MSEDRAFEDETTKLVLGPIDKHRWIYACSKQLLDRVIHAYGMQHGLRYTIFRPFNWIGPRLDNVLDARRAARASSRSSSATLAARREDPARRRRLPAPLVPVHRRRHRRPAPHHREPRRLRGRTHLQPGEPGQPLLGPPPGRNDAGDGRPLPGIRRIGQAHAHRRDLVDRVLRPGLPRRAGPPPRHLGDAGRSRLEPARLARGVAGGRSSRPTAPTSSMRSICSRRTAKTTEPSKGRPGSRRFRAWRASA